MVSGFIQHPALNGSRGQGGNWITIQHKFTPGKPFRNNYKKNWDLWICAVIQLDPPCKHSQPGAFGYFWRFKSINKELLKRVYDVLWLWENGHRWQNGRISWRRAVAPAGDWFFRLPGHARTIRWKNEIHINVCIVCPSTSFVITNLYWSPRGTQFDSRYPTAANRSLCSGFCRGLWPVTPSECDCPGGNRLYVRGRLLSSVALTPGFGYFWRFKSTRIKKNAFGLGSWRCLSMYNWD